MERAVREVSIMQLLAELGSFALNDLNYLINCEFETSKNNFLLQMPYFSDSIQKRLENKLSKQELLNYIFLAIIAVQKLHAYGFLHGDVKPENMLLLNKFDLVLIDFGNSFLLEKIKEHFTFAGDLAFIPEEAIQQEFDEFSEKIDTFGLAKTALNFLKSLNAPLDENTEKELNSLLLSASEENPGDRIGTDELLKGVVELIQRDYKQSPKQWKELFEEEEQFYK